MFASVSGGAQPLTYEWTPEDGLSDPTSEFTLASPEQTTTYRLKVTDANGSFRTDFVTVFVIQQLDLKVYLEGPFNGTYMNTDLNIGGYLPLSQPFNEEPWNYTGTENVASIPNTDIVDWILIEIRETTGSADDAKFWTMVERQAAFLKENGQIVGLDGTNLPFTDVRIDDNCYIVIWHRNHYEIMSANAVPFFWRNSYL